MTLVSLKLATNETIKDRIRIYTALNILCLQWENGL